LQIYKILIGFRYFAISKLKNKRSQETRKAGNKGNLEQKKQEKSKPGTKKPRKPWNPKTRINQDIKKTRNQNIQEKLGNQEIFEYRRKMALNYSG